MKALHMMYIPFLNVHETELNLQNKKSSSTRKKTQFEFSSLFKTTYNKTSGKMLSNMCHRGD
jgi:hypothetical protein